MFKKKVCGGCGKTLKDKYDFCPYCGNVLREKEGDFGMLGKDDSASMNFNDFKLPGGLNSLFNSILRNLDKQLKDQGKGDRKDEKKGNISISISTFGNQFPPMNVNPSKGEQDKRKQTELKKFFFENFKSDKQKKFSKLPKSEPKTNIRRIENKVVYEVNLPGVNSVKDISILNLEKSMELRAVSEKKAYLKSIPMNLPISDFKFSKGKFVLELDAGASIA